MNIGYQVVTSIDEMNLVRKLTTILANWLAVAGRGSLRGSDRCSFGTLSVEGSDNGVSGVLAIIRLEAILN